MFVIEKVLRCVAGSTFPGTIGSSLSLMSRQINTAMSISENGEKRSQRPYFGLATAAPVKVVQLYALEPCFLRKDPHD